MSELLEKVFEESFILCGFVSIFENFLKKMRCEGETLVKNW